MHHHIIGPSYSRNSCLYLAPDGELRARRQQALLLVGVQRHGLDVARACRGTGTAQRQHRNLARCGAELGLLLLLLL